MYMQSSKKKKNKRKKAGKKGRVAVCSPPRPPPLTVLSCMVWVSSPLTLLPWLLMLRDVMSAAKAEYLTRQTCRRQNGMSLYPEAACRLGSIYNCWCNVPGVQGSRGSGKQGGGSWGKPPSNTEQMRHMQLLVSIMRLKGSSRKTDTCKNVGIEVQEGGRQQGNILYVNVTSESAYVFAPGHATAV